MSTTVYSQDDMHPSVALGHCNQCGAEIFQQAGQPAMCDACLLAQKPEAKKKAANG